MARPPTDADLRIIAMLRKDARQPLARIAEATGVPVSTVYDRIKAHEKTRAFVKKHTTIVDFPRLGYSIRTLVLAKAADRSRLRAFAQAHPNVNTCYVVSGAYDLALECVFRYMHEYQSFIDGLAKRATRHEILYIADEPKKETFLSSLEEAGSDDQDRG
ncbi:Lrp/AsnC ligand binding domain-containing protein [Candidatus Woesearchaeota archaeon]|nr:Lrp/AsnC ligand binding domain-containing protein [Candidatus Woesearchaeota archaeon]